MMKTDLPVFLFEEDEALESAPEDLLVFLVSGEYFVMEVGGGKWPSSTLPHVKQRTGISMMAGIFPLE
jgi:hypothetical protein